MNVEAIHEIEQACFDEPWSLSAINGVLENPDSVCVHENYGFALGIKLQGEAELYRIAVLLQYRGQGLAYSLLLRFLEKCNCPVFLEVAARNASAVRLYQKCGFVEIARRKNYYKNDDAIIFKKEIEERPNEHD